MRLEDAGVVEPGVTPPKWGAVAVTDFDWVPVSGQSSWKKTLDNHLNVHQDPKQAINHQLQGVPDFDRQTVIC